MLRLEIGTRRCLFSGELDRNGRFAAKDGRWGTRCLSPPCLASGGVTSAVSIRVLERLLGDLHLSRSIMRKRKVIDTRQREPMPVTVTRLVHHHRPLMHVRQQRGPVIGAAVWEGGRGLSRAVTSQTCRWESILERPTEWRIKLSQWALPVSRHPPRESLPFRGTDASCPHYLLPNCHLHFRLAHDILFLFFNSLF